MTSQADLNHLVLFLFYLQLYALGVTDSPEIEFDSDVVRYVDTEVLMYRIIQFVIKPQKLLR